MEYRSKITITASLMSRADSIRVNVGIWGKVKETGFPIHKFRNMVYNYKHEIFEHLNR